MSSNKFHPNDFRWHLQLFGGCSWLRSFHRSVRARSCNSLQRSDEPVTRSLNEANHGLSRGACLFDVFFFLRKGKLGNQGGKPPSISAHMYIRQNIICTYIYMYFNNNIYIYIYLDLYIEIRYCHRKYVCCR